MKVNFDIGISTDTCNELLLNFFKNEVGKRGYNFVEVQSQLKSIRSVSEWITMPTQHFGLYLGGITGNGKTTLVAALRQLMNFLKVKDPISDLSYSPYAGILKVGAKELYDLFETERQKYSRCKDTFMLAIDDFGTEERDLFLFGNHYTPVEDLLCYRYERMLPTIITTNLPTEYVRQKYGDRLADRFSEMMEIVTMPDFNFRNKKLSYEQSSE